MTDQNHLNEWEVRYQEGDTPWNRDEPSPGLSDFLKAEPLAGKVLVPGCGFGHDVRAIASPQNEVIGLDISPSAIRAARELPKTANESYVCGDLFDLPNEFSETWKESFDWIWEHTCFCAIDPSRRADYVMAVSELLKPGGHLLAIFYLDPGEPDEGPPFGTTLKELDALFGEKFRLVREWLPKRNFPGREGEEWMRLLRRSANG